MLQAGKMRHHKQNVSWPLQRDEISIIKFTLIKPMITELKFSLPVGIGLYRREEHL